MRAESHIKAFDEHKKTLIDWGIKTRGLENSQRTVGLHASRAIIELLSAYLHEKGLITLGAQLNHRWFKSPKAGNKLPEFSKKEEVVNKLHKLENLCEELAYGSDKPKKEIEEAIALFQDLEKTIEDLRK